MNALKQYSKVLVELRKQRKALADKLAQSPLAKKMARIDAILGSNGDEGVSAYNKAPRAKRSRNGGTVKEQILAALKNGPMGAKELQKITGTQYVFIPLSEMKREKSIVSDGKRPATFSLK